MPTITEKTTKQSSHPCGFCSTGNRHDLCPGGVLNGNQTEVVLCGCKEHPIEARCLDCGARGDEVSQITWTCLDVEACDDRRAKRRRESSVALFGAQEDGTPRTPVTLKEKAAKAAPKPKTGKCLCCGETTGGGLFRPGHDSKYLTRYAELVKTGGATLELVQEQWAQEGISEALRAKLAKRVA